jgi:phenylacetate-CoA ligase
VTLVREGLLGPSYFHHRRLIEQSKSWSPEQIKEYQEKRFQRLIRRYGDELTQKDDYRQNLARYTRWDLPLVARTVRTSGTSGQPLHFQASTLARRQKERAYQFDIWSQIGYKPHDLRVCYRGDIYHGLLHFDKYENAWMISAAETVESELGTLRSWLRTQPPFFLHVHSSSLATFIDLVGEDLFRSLPIRGVIAASEPFPAGERARFEQDYGLQVAHWYGHSEYAVMAYCCRKCGGFHFYPTYGYLELLPSEVEGCQRVVATAFNRMGTQFVRYETTDLAVAPTGTCSADHFPRVDSIMGRTRESFVDDAGRRRSLFGYLFGDINNPLWDQIKELQVVQEKAGSLRIRIVPQPGAQRERIEKFLLHRMPMVTLEFEYVTSIERSASFKRKYFVDAMQGA